MKARFNNQDDARCFPISLLTRAYVSRHRTKRRGDPTAALQMGNEGHFVWVLNDENKVSKHCVTPGIQDSQKVVISAGFPRAIAWSRMALIA